MRNKPLGRRAILRSLAAVPAAGLLGVAHRLQAAPPLRIERVEAIKVVVPMRAGVVMSSSSRSVDRTALSRRLVASICAIAGPSATPSTI